MSKNIFLDQAREHFARLFRANPIDSIFFAPGRVNIIGEHLDYNGGHVFPAALDLGIYAFFSFTQDNRLQLHSLDQKKSATIPLDQAINYKQSDGWINYVLGIIQSMQADGFKIRGAQILVASTLPQGSGLSSSAALELLFAYAILQQNQEHEINDAQRQALALRCQKVENEFIGVQCGIMDQFAIALGKKEHCLLLNTKSLAYRHIPLSLGEYELLIINSQKPRQLAESAFNDRRQQSQEALAAIHNAGVNITSLAEAKHEHVNKIKDTVLRHRAKHVIEEQQRVLEGVEILQKRQLPDFGRLLDQSHASLRDFYQVTGRELDCLVEAARHSPGCIGARMTGAGFGGCAIALVACHKIDHFIESTNKEYRQKIGLNAKFYRTKIGDGVRQLTFSQD